MHRRHSLGLRPTGGRSGSRTSRRPSLPDYAREPSPVRRPVSAQFRRPASTSAAVPPSTHKLVRPGSGYQRSFDAGRSRGLVGGGGVTPPVRSSTPHMLLKKNTSSAVCVAAATSSSLSSTVANALLTSRPPTAPQPSAVTKVKAATITKSGEATMAVYSWGGNVRGQCGSSAIGGQQGLPACVSEPSLTKQQDGVRIEAVGAGGAHSLLVSELGDVWGLGAGLVGQAGPCSSSNDSGDAAGHGSPSNPTMVPTDACRPQLVLGRNAVAGCLRASGLELGRSSAVRIVAVACGMEHNVAVTDSGRLLCWGRNDRGQLGLGGASELPSTSLRETQVTSSPREPSHEGLRRMHVVAASCGPDFTAAVTASGAVFSFGSNEKGQLGLGHCSDARSPARVEGRLLGCRVVQVACGDRHTLFAAEQEWVIFSCGLSLQGQLGAGPANVKQGGGSSTSVDFVSSPMPVLFPRENDTPTPSQHPQNARSRARRPLKVAAGGSSSGYVTHDGSLHVWGNNEYGQLGLGKAAIAHACPTPALVEAFPRQAVRILHVSLGQRHLAAVSDLGNVYCCGQIDGGCLGVHPSKLSEETCLVFTGAGTNSGVGFAEKAPDASKPRQRPKRTERVQSVPFMLSGLSARGNFTQAVAAGRSHTVALGNSVPIASPRPSTSASLKETGSTVALDPVVPAKSVAFGTGLDGNGRPDGDTRSPSAMALLDDLHLASHLSEQALKRTGFQGLPNSSHRKKPQAERCTEAWGKKSLSTAEASVRVVDASRWHEFSVQSRVASGKDRLDSVNRSLGEQQPKTDQVTVTLVLKYRDNSAPSKAHKSRTASPAGLSGGKVKTCSVSVTMGGGERVVGTTSNEGAGEGASSTVVAASGQKMQKSDNLLRVCAESAATWPGAPPKSASAGRASTSSSSKKLGRHAVARPLLLLEVTEAPGDGRHHVRYRLAIPGFLSIHVQLNAPDVQPPPLAIKTSNRQSPGSGTEALHASRITAKERKEQRSINAIEGSPFYLVVAPGEVDPAWCTLRACSGSSLTQVQAGTTVQFEILSNAWGGFLCGKPGIGFRATLVPSGRSSGDGRDSKAAIPQEKRTHKAGHTRASPMRGSGGENASDEIHVAFQHVGNGVYRGRFTQNTAGSYTLHVATRKPKVASDTMTRPLAAEAVKATAARGVRLHHLQTRMSVRPGPVDPHQCRCWAELPGGAENHRAEEAGEGGRGNLGRSGLLLPEVPLALGGSLGQSNSTLMKLPGSGSSPPPVFVLPKNDTSMDGVAQAVFKVQLCDAFKNVIGEPEGTVSVSVQRRAAANPTAENAASGPNDAMVPGAHTATADAKWFKPHVDASRVWFDAQSSCFVVSCQPETSPASQDLRDAFGAKSSTAIVLDECSLDVVASSSAEQSSSRGAGGGFATPPRATQKTSGSTCPLGTVPFRFFVERKQAVRSQEPEALESPCEAHPLCPNLSATMSTFHLLRRVPEDVQLPEKFVLWAPVNRALVSKGAPCAASTASVQSPSFSPRRPSLPAVVKYVKSCECSLPCSVQGPPTPAWACGSLTSRQHGLGDSVDVHTQPPRPAEEAAAPSCCCKAMGKQEGGGGAAIGAAGTGAAGMESEEGWYGVPVLVETRPGCDSAMNRLMAGARSMVGPLLPRAASAHQDAPFVAASPAVVASIVRLLATLVADFTGGAVPTSAVELTLDPWIERLSSTSVPAAATVVKAKAEGGGAGVATKASGNLAERGSPSSLVLRAGELAVGAAMAVAAAAGCPGPEQEQAAGRHDGGLLRVADVRAVLLKVVCDAVGLACALEPEMKGDQFVSPFGCRAIFSESALSLGGGAGGGESKRFAVDLMHFPHPATPVPH